MEELLSKYSFKDIIFMRGLGGYEYGVYITSLEDLKRNKYQYIYNLSGSCKTYLRDEIDRMEDIEKAFKDFINIALSILIRMTPKEERYRCVKMVNTTLGVCMTFEDKYISGIDFKLNKSCKSFMYNGIKIASNLTSLAKFKRKELLKEFSDKMNGARDDILYDLGKSTGVIEISEKCYRKTKNVDSIQICIYEEVSNIIGLQKVSNFYRSLNTEDYAEYLNKANHYDLYSKISKEMDEEGLVNNCINFYKLIDDLIYKGVDWGIEEDDPLVIYGLLFNDTLSYFVSGGSVKINRRLTEELLDKLLRNLEPSDAVYIDLFYRKYILSKIKDKG